MIADVIVCCTGVQIYIVSAINILSKQGIWFRVVHHITNEHQLVLSYGRGQNACSHGPLGEERTAEWLRRGSPSHKDFKLY